MDKAKAKHNKAMVVAKARSKGKGKGKVTPVTSTKTTKRATAAIASPDGCGCAETLPKSKRSKNSNSNSSAAHPDRIFQDTQKTRQEMIRRMPGMASTGELKNSRGNDDSVTDNAGLKFDMTFLTIWYSSRCLCNHL